MTVFTIPEGEDLVLQFRILYETPSNSYNFCLAYKANEESIILTDDEDFIEYLEFLKYPKYQDGLAPILWQNATGYGWSLIGNENFLEHFSE